MDHLIPLMKQIEIQIRSDSALDKYIWEELTKLTDWDYKIIQDFILRVKLYMQNNNLNFVYKFYQKNINEFKIKKSEAKIDLLIVSLKRDKIDTVLTDVFNRVPTPQNLSKDYLEIWGEQVTQARNFAVKEALRRNAKYLLFIDDDIIASQGSIMQLFDTLNKTNCKVVAGQYYRKMNPLMTAHGNLQQYDKFDALYTTDLCAMGFVLIDIDYITQHVPLPLFWEFGAPDGYWSMGEDAFFTKNMIEYTNQKPVVDTNIQLLHYDKMWKKWYGQKDNNVIYATNAIDNLDQFERLRIPKQFPLITICTPTREENDPIAVNLNEMLLLRGYKTESMKCYGLKVDDARTELVKHALKINSDYVLFIDDDIIPPIDGLCQLLEVFESKSNNTIGCVSGDYCLKGQPSYSVHLQLNDSGLVTELDRIRKSDVIIYNDWLIGLGFALIDINFFKQARMPWFKCHTRNNKDIDVNEDAHFSELMFQNGYNILINTNVKCLHVDYQNEYIYGYDDKLDLTKYAYSEWLKKYQYISFNETKRNYI